MCLASPIVKERVVQRLQRRRCTQRIPAKNWSFQFGARAVERCSDLRWAHNLLRFQWFSFNSPRPSQTRMDKCTRSSRALRALRSSLNSGIFTQIISLWLRLLSSLMIVTSFFRKWCSGFNANYYRKHTICCDWWNCAPFLAFVFSLSIRPLVVTADLTVFLFNLFR